MTYVFTQYFGLYKVLSLKLLLVSFFYMILIASYGVSPIALIQKVVAQQPTPPTSNSSELHNTASANKGDLSTVLNYQSGCCHLKSLVHSSNRKR